MRDWVSVTCALICLDMKIMHFFPSEVLVVVPVVSSTKAFSAMPDILSSISWLQVQFFFSWLQVFIMFSYSFFHHCFVYLFRYWYVISGYLRNLYSTLEHTGVFVGEYHYRLLISLGMPFLRRHIISIKKTGKLNTSVKFRLFFSNHHNFSHQSGVGWSLFFF